jgi:hypothetical protein
MYLVLVGSQNKQPLFPYTALTDWFLQPRRSVYCAVRTGYLNVTQTNHFGFQTVPWVGQLIAGLSPRGLGFDPVPWVGQLIAGLSPRGLGFDPVPWVGKLIAGLSPRGLGFYPRSVDVGFVADNVALGQVSLRVLRLSPVSIISPMFNTHLHLQVALTRMTEQN